VDGADGTNTRGVFGSGGCTAAALSEALRDAYGAASRLINIGWLIRRIDVTKEITSGVDNLGNQMPGLTSGVNTLNGNVITLNNNIPFGTKIPVVPRKIRVRYPTSPSSPPYFNGSGLPMPACGDRQACTMELVDEGLHYSWPGVW
jgi:hypothetical protein